MQQAARTVVAAGRRGGDIFAVAEKALADCAHRDEMFFVAHGMGLITHEVPRLTGTGPVPYPADHAAAPLEAGMVLSIETWVENREVGFVKLEDTLIVTDDGWEAPGDTGRGWNRVGRQVNEHVSPTVAPMALHGPEPDALRKIRAHNAATRSWIVVLEDDPTGCQAMYDATVLIEPTTEELARAARERRVTFVWTNTRSLPEARAVEVNRALVRSAIEAATRAGARPVFVSRSDSTLRGHFAAEVSAVVDTWSSSQEAVEAFPAQCRDVPFRDRVRPRCPDRRADDADVGAGQDGVELSSSARGARS